MSEQFFVDGRPVSELKVVELRKELELRSLPKSGNKKELVERLENFLRDEQAEMRRQQQQEQQKIVDQQQQVVVQQQQAEPEQANLSPAAAVKPADMVAQYLAQQQIQLEAARRDADKLRASTSSSTEEGPGEEQPTQMVQESPKQQPAAAESADAEDTLAKKTPEKFKVEAVMVTTTAAEFIPEEPTSQSVEQEEEEGGEFVPDEPEQQQREAEPKDEEHSPKDVTTTAGEVDVQSSTVPSTGDNEVAKAEEEEEEVVKEDNVELDLEEGEEEYVEEEEEDDESEPDERRRQHSPIATKDTHQTTSIQDSHVSSVSDQAETVPAAAPAAANGGQPGQVSVVHHQQATQQESSSVVVPSAAPLGQSRRHSSAAAHQVAEESSKPVYEPETTQDGLTRRRPASPARNPPSRWLHIRGLKRPFTNRGLLELLGKFGTVDTDHFWIDSIKSNCIVTFEAEEQAQLARERLHNVVWPPANDGCLVVEYSTEEKLNRRKEEEEQSSLPSSLEAKLFPGAAAMSLQERSAAFGGPPPVPAPGGLGLTIVVDNRVADSAGPQVHIQHDKEQMLEAENRKRKAEELVKSQKTLDELFKKTTTLPSLYFLPLSDEQAAKRTKYSSNSSSKAHASASRSGHSSGHHHRDREDNHRATSRSGAGGGGREDRRGAGAVQGDVGAGRDDRHGRSAGGSHSRR